MVYLIHLAVCHMSLTCTLENSTILVCSFFYFLYIVLDNIDGKQARRTKNSTPLGMIFDHQVDAICVTITTSFMATAALYGNSHISLFIWLAGAFPFFLATWEELYVGVQIFPVVNGPSDGCLLVGVLMLALGLVGPDYFANSYYSGIRYIDFICVFFGSSSFLIGLYK